MQNEKRTADSAEGIGKGAEKGLETEPSRDERKEETCVSEFKKKKPQNWLACEMSPRAQVTLGHKSLNWICDDSSGGCCW